MSVTLDELEAILEDLEEGAIPVVCGDFNGNIGRKGGIRGKGTPTKAGITVLNFMARQNLLAANLTQIATGQIDTYEGHNGRSLIDYIMVPEYISDRVTRCHTGQNEALNSSDHLPIEATLNIDTLPRCVAYSCAQKRIRWEKCSEEFLRNNYQNQFAIDTQDIKWTLSNDEISDKDIDVSVEAIIGALHKAAEVVPRSKFVKHLKPFWNSDLNILKKDKMKWFNMWKCEGRTTCRDDKVRCEMLRSKKVFNKAVSQISRKYQNDLITEAASKSEINHDDFWRLLNRSKGGSRSKVSAIRNQDDQVVYEIDEILEVWRSHFDKISTPTMSDKFDDKHFLYVTKRVRELRQLKDISKFLESPFNQVEVSAAINKLNNRKAPGYDGITSEHLKHAGEPLCHLIRLLFNHCIRLEYIPLSLKKGIQVPLYKGKKTCILDCDNYRGITLLSTLNKLLEVLIWERINGWWVRDRVIADLQGAGRRGHSCIHTALTLQETIAKERESNKKVFVAYYDVSKAFDSVWIDGLFCQLYNLGITGSLWRILYQMYVNFVCCVRIGDKTSNWYKMECGIHQGGYLSLVKYTAFINSLITSLEESNLCSIIYRVKTSPVGYADDMAASTTSKNKMDRIMSIVHNHGCTWRYSLNASKSAVLVFGETQAERKIASDARVFKLGRERVKERLFYDHVGVKTCVKGDTYVRTEEKIIKARKCLNMSTSIGIMKGGINIRTCNVIYRSVVLPTVCFGCEVWFLKGKDEQLLLAFQRYAARRIQRLHPRSLNITSSACLGWMSIVNYIKARKIIFIRTIAVMEEFFPLRRILVERTLEFNAEVSNEWESPIIQILQFCEQFNLLDHVKSMCRGTLLSKTAWKKLVWERVWEFEKREWQENMSDDPKMDVIHLISPSPAYSVWWTLSDKDHKYMRRCETMVRLLCHSSLLKSDDCRLKRAPFGARMCILCDNAADEDVRHMVTQCQYHHTIREKMLAMINDIVRLDGQIVFRVLLGKPIDGVDN